MTDPWDNLQATVAAEGCPEFDSWVSKMEWLALAWSGEVGEVANEVKKIRRDDGGLTGERSARVLSELVDATVYQLVMLDHLGVRFSRLHDLVRAAHEAFLARTAVG